MVLDLFIERKYLMVLFNDFFLQFEVFFLKLVDEIEVRLFLNVGGDHLLLKTFEISSKILFKLCLVLFELEYFLFQENVLSFERVIILFNLQKLVRLNRERFRINSFI